MENMERSFQPLAGIVGIAVQFALLGGGLISFSFPFFEGFGIFLVLAGLLMFKGYFTVSAGASKIIIVAGTYKGTVREPGFYWLHPFAQRLNLSLKTQHSKTAIIRANDRAGHTLQAQMGLRWRIADTAKAYFETEKPEETLVHLAENILLNAISNGYWHEGAPNGQTPLKDRLPQLQAQLAQSVAEKMKEYGLELLDVYLPLIEYTPEVQAALLHKKQLMLTATAKAQYLWKIADHAQQILAKMGEDATIAPLAEEKRHLFQQLVLALASGQPLKNFE